MHRHRCSKEHTSATYLYKAQGHRKDAMAANTLGGSVKDKGWDAERTYRGGMANVVYCSSNYLLKKLLFCSIHTS